MNRRTKPRLKLILNMPDRVSAKTKISSSIFTAIFWALFIYLWIPLITLIAWAFGIYHAYNEVTYAREFVNFKHLAFIYSLVVVALAGALLLWALKEFLRFRDSTRRRAPLTVESSELANYASIPLTQLAQWQNTRRMVAHHDDHGHVQTLTEEHVALHHSQDPLDARLQPV